MKWLLFVLLLVGCSRDDDMVMMCTLDGKAHFIRGDFSWRVYRVPGADHLCPKKSEQPKSMRMGVT